MKAHDVLQTLRVTEKASMLSADLGQYTFVIAPGATKADVKAAVEQTFKVGVTRVNIVRYAGKSKRSRTGILGQRSGSKRAIVTLKSGDKIELA